MPPHPAGTATAAPDAPRPDTSRAAILAAASVEFAAKGLAGARVDGIAARSRVNKQLVYYYFGSKEGLYAATLDAAYADIRRREQELQLGGLAPDRAMERLIGFSFDYLQANPGFIQLLNDANVHGGAHIAGSPTIQGRNSPLIALVAETLRRGVDAELFRPGIDPVWLYVSVAGMAYFFFSNRATLSAIFARDLSDAAAAHAYRAHAIGFVMNALRPDAAAIQPDG